MTGVAAAAKPGVPMDASEIIKETISTLEASTEDEEQMGTCCRFFKNGKKSTQCITKATVRPHSGKNSHLVYCKDFMKQYRGETTKERMKSGLIKGRSLR